MLYAALRAIARVALRWYYGDILVHGRNHIPSRGPVLVVANHPNALIDALLVGTTFPRRVLITGKATLFEHPAMASLLSAIGVVPLRRAQDEREGLRRTSVSSRNEDAFHLVIEALRRGEVVLIFPEGISHDRPSLAPMRSGAARIALRARASGVQGVQIVPVGLVFEQKERPKSRVLVRIGPVIDLDTMHTSSGVTGAAALTSHVASALRAVTLGFATEERAARAVLVARALAAASSEPQSLAGSAMFLSEVEIAGRIERATEALDAAPRELTDRADAFIQRIATLERQTAALGVTLHDVRISLRLRRGAWFVVRELLLLVVAGPPALLGWLVHRPPIAAARALALRTLVGDASRDQPAMRTILAGLVLMSAWYAVLLVVAAKCFGVPMALLWLAAFFAAGQLQLAIGPRLVRAFSRARTYIALRRNAALREQLLIEFDSMVAEAEALESALNAS